MILILTVVGLSSSMSIPSTSMPFCSRSLSRVARDSSFPVMPTIFTRSPRAAAFMATFAAPPGTKVSRCTSTTWTGASGEMRETSPQTYLSSMLSPMTMMRFPLKRSRIFWRCPMLLSLRLQPGDIVGDAGPRREPRLPSQGFSYPRDVRPGIDLVDVRVGVVEIFRPEGRLHGLVEVVDDFVEGGGLSRADIEDAAFFRVRCPDGGGNDVLDIDMVPDLLAILEYPRVPAGSHLPVELVNHARRFSLVLLSRAEDVEVPHAHDFQVLCVLLREIVHEIL